MTEFGKNLRRFRKQARLTQEEVAEKTGIAQQTLSAYENGGCKAKYPVLVELAKLLKCSPDDLDPLYKHDDVHYENRVNCKQGANCPFGDISELDGDIL